MRNINRTVLTGGLTRDPELRRTRAGAAVATMRIAFTTQQRIDSAWQERSNYIDVELFGAQAESAAKHLTRGRQVAVDGRLEWREYEGRDGVRRQVHRIVADSVQYLPDGRAAAAAEPARSDNASAETSR
jgi:single-strand DNA-binding protein